MRSRFLVPMVGLLLALPALAAPSLVERLKDEEYLTAVRKDVRMHRRSVVTPEQNGPLQDVRCVIHAHSGLSHDSRGTEAEIVAAAKAANVRAVFMTEHPTPDRRWQKEGLRGEKDGVLFIPGAELSDGLLVWKGEKAEWTPEMKAAAVLDSLKGTDGVAFVAHPEHRETDADWELPPFSGMEIYNTHADAVDHGDEKLLDQLRGENPLKLLSLLSSLKKFQKEAFGAIFDAPVMNLQRWDALNARYLGTSRRVVGIAGNDSHQNVGVAFEMGDDSVVVKDALGKTVSEVPKKNLPLFLLAGLGGASDLNFTFDPYPVSFGYVNTHILASEVKEDALFDALKKGRAYVSFDWMGDPTGFRFTAKSRGKEREMGDEIRAKDKPVLTVRAPASGEMRILRNGEEVQRGDASELTFEAKEPGVYRAECWMEVAGEKRPWIYSNPIFVTKS